jgi:hypothetical protein
MAATPSAMPVSYSLYLNDGVISLRMMRPQWASVSMPSRPLPYLDAQLAIVHGHQQQHAVVFAPLPQPPRIEHPVGYFLQHFALQRGDGKHHDLVGGGIFVRLQFPLQLGLGRLRKNLRVIIHPPRQLRHRNRRKSRQGQ